MQSKYVMTEIGDLQYFWSKKNIQSVYFNYHKWTSRKSCKLVGSWYLHAYFGSVDVAGNGKKVGTQNTEMDQKDEKDKNLQLQIPRKDWDDF